MRKILDLAIGAAALLACLLLVAMVMVTFATIVLRPFQVLVSGHEEIATFAMVGMAFLGLPYTYRTGAHVRVETLLNGTLDSGNHLIHWDGRDTRGNLAPAGIYFVGLRSEDRTEVRKITLMR